MKNDEDLKKLYANNEHNKLETIKLTYFLFRVWSYKVKMYLFIFDYSFGSNWTYLVFEPLTSTLVLVYPFSLILR